jgi:hypothetical protein
VLFTISAPLDQGQFIDAIGSIQIGNRRLNLRNVTCRHVAKVGPLIQLPDPD